MREYYTLAPQSFNFHGNSKLKTRIGKFKEKHFSAGVFTYWSMHGWGHGECIRTIFLYKENGVFYEFFSGYKIGTIKSTDRGTYIIGEVLEPILLSPIGPETFQQVHQLTSSQFASDIEYHMKEKRQIAKIMNEYFNLHHQIRLIEEQNRVASEVAKMARDSHNADWLEKYLDKR